MDALDLELQMVVNCLAVWVLGINARSLGRAACVLTHGAVSPAPCSRDFAFAASGNSKRHLHDSYLDQKGHFPLVISGAAMRASHLQPYIGWLR